MENTSAEETQDSNWNSVEENEWSRLIEAKFKEGYVEGKYQGEESTVQSGFDRGYELGFGMSYPVSILKGLLVVNQIQQKDSNPESAERSKETKQLLNTFEQKWLQSGPNESADREFQDLKEQVFRLLKECNPPRIFEELARRFEKWNLSLSKNNFTPEDNPQESSKSSSTAAD